MQLTTDNKYNVGYVKIIQDAKVAYSVEIDAKTVGDFDERHNLVGIELLDAKSYKPGDLQLLMSKANAEALKLRGQGDIAPTSTPSA